MSASCIAKSTEINQEERTEFTQEVQILERQIEEVQSDRVSCAEAAGWTIAEPADDAFLVCNDGTHIATVRREDDVAILRATDTVAFLAVHTPAPLESLQGSPSFDPDEANNSINLDDIVLGPENEPRGSWAAQLVFTANPVNVDARFGFEFAFDNTSSGEDAGIRSDLTLLNIYVVTEFRDILVDGRPWGGKEGEPTWCPDDAPVSELNFAAGSTTWQLSATEPESNGSGAQMDVLSFCIFGKDRFAEIVPLIKSGDLPDALRVDIQASWLRGITID